MSEKRMEKIQKLGEKKKAGKLAGYATSKDVDERRAAATALGNINEDDAYNTLVGMLRDPDTCVQGAAMTALATMGRPSAAEHIRHTMAGKNDAELSKVGTAALAKLHNAHDN